MADDTDSKGGAGVGEFERHAERAAKTSTGPVGEFMYFLGRTRKFWMAPLIVALLLAGLIVVAGGTAFAPLIYALF